MLIGFTIDIKPESLVSQPSKVIGYTMPPIVPYIVIGLTTIPVLPHEQSMVIGSTTYYTLRSSWMMIGSTICWTVRSSIESVKATVF
jgi:hypothetical protein